jgi:hypothetical protein
VPNFKWWALQEIEDPAPYAVVAVEADDLLPRRYVPGEGLVDWPSATMYCYQGEPGARRISQEEALELIRKRVGQLSAENLALGRGKAPTIQPPKAM